jgi:amino acid transporter
MTGSTSNSESLNALLEAVAGIFVATGFLVLIAFAFLRGGEWFQRNPVLVRRAMLAMAILYSASSAYGVVEVILGHEPLTGLIGLPFSLIFIWTFLRAARQMRIAPNPQKDRR